MVGGAGVDGGLGLDGGVGLVGSVGLVGGVGFVGVVGFVGAVGVVGVSLPDGVWSFVPGASAGASGLPVEHAVVTTRARAAMTARQRARVHTFSGVDSNRGRLCCTGVGTSYPTDVPDARSKSPRQNVGRRLRDLQFRQADYGLASEFNPDALAAD